jgi:hypothetical protein
MAVFVDQLARHRGTCESCRITVIWARTDAGKAMPVNVKPDPENGNVTLTRMPGGQLRAAVLTRGQAAGARVNGIRLYTSHFVDCPRAADHRRRSRRP